MNRRSFLARAVGAIAGAIGLRKAAALEQLPAGGGLITTGSLSCQRYDGAEITFEEMRRVMAKLELHQRESVMPIEEWRGLGRDRLAAFVIKVDKTMLERAIHKKIPDSFARQYWL